jgi:peptidoglycan hydrolase CwlO-like protein
MKQTIIACLVTAAACITFSTIFMLVMQKPIQDHSQKFKDLELIDERVRKNEIIAFNRIDSLYKVYSHAQKQIDSLGAKINASSSKFSSYEKQLVAIKANIKTTNYQDSSKTVILKNLPK